MTYIMSIVSWRTVVSAAAHTIDGKMSAGLRIAVDPALRELAHEVCAREGVELSDVVRAAIVIYLRDRGVAVNYTPRRPGRPQKARTRA